ncbi:MAG: hypothetical protein V1903_13545 [Bacteroidota bacterium]
MSTGFEIPAPFQFNPLKHHLSYIREFVSQKLPEIRLLVKDLKRIGTSVMDIYTGSLSVKGICDEVLLYLESEKLMGYEVFAEWAGKDYGDFRMITLSDSSKWTLKFHDDRMRYVHLFPARFSPRSKRVKSNTLKSAILYYILIGKDFISADDLNRARALLGLSPVRDPADTEAITEMIEILRI